MFEFIMGKPRILSIEDFKYRIVDLELDENVLKGNKKDYIKKHGIYINKKVLKHVEVSRYGDYTTLKANGEKGYFGCKEKFSIIVPQNFYKIMLNGSGVRILSTKNTNVDEIIATNESKTFFHSDWCAKKLRLKNEYSSSSFFECNLAVKDFIIDGEICSSFIVKDDSHFMIDKLDLKLMSSTFNLSEYSVINNVSNLELKAKSKVTLGAVIKQDISDLLLIEESNNELSFLSSDFITAIQDSINIRLHIDMMIRGQDFIKIDTNSPFDLDADLFYNNLDDTFDTLDRELADLDNEFSEIDKEMDDIDKELDNILPEDDLFTDSAQGFDFLGFDENKIVKNSNELYKKVYESENKEYEILELLKSDYPTDLLNNKNREGIKNKLSVFIKNEEYLDVPYSDIDKIKKLCFVLDVPFKDVHDKSKIAKF